MLGGSNMVLKFKDRSSPKNKIRIHVCGLTGHGKSTFAEEYCQQAGLKPIVIDIDDTNYATPANPDIDFIGNDRQIFTKICDLIDEIIPTDFDTIIYDGYDSSMEKITPKQKERNPFWHLNVRKQRCEAIMNKLLNSGKHLIFIGQLDSKIVDDPENRPSYPVKAMNNCVNVSYFCHVTKKGEFVYDIMKNRFGKLLQDCNVYDPIPYIVKQDQQVSETPVNNDFVHEDAPQLIIDCIDALTARGMTITPELVKNCIKDRCKDETEYNECKEYLDNISFEGSVTG